MTLVDPETASASPEPAPRGSSLPSRLAFAFQVAYVRLRFILIVVAIFLVLAAWQQLSHLRDALWVRFGGTAAAGPGVSPDTEYFCPMCPGVLSQWPEKCPVCKMPLVRRKKGEAVLLPEGVLARMQLSPYRVQLAGVATVPVRYESLQRQWSGVGTVSMDPERATDVVAPRGGIVQVVHEHLLWKGIEPDEALAIIVVTDSLPNGDLSKDGASSTNSGSETVEVRSPRSGHLTRLVAQRGQHVSRGDLIAEVADLQKVYVTCFVAPMDLPFVQEHQTVAIAVAGNAAAETVTGTVQAVQPALEAHGTAGVRIEVQNRSGRLRPGLLVDVHWSVPVAEFAPFDSLPRNAPPRTAEEPSEVFTCEEHPRYVHLQPGKCLFHDQELHHQPLAEDQRVRWTCVAHPHISSMTAGECPDCGGLPLIAQIVTYSPPGQVLTIPEGAVIDTGTSQWVFVETGPGMFDAVPVRLGPPCGKSYPVLQGLSSGQRVVASGAFLLDAETRLNPSLAAAYFGAAPRAEEAIASTATSRVDESGTVPTLDEGGIPAADLARIRWQRVCPVTQLPLGSMGAPIRVRAGEQVIYLCCAGCTDRVRGATAPEQYSQPTERCQSQPGTSQTENLSPSRDTSNSN